MSNHGLVYFIRGLTASLGSDGEPINEPLEDAASERPVARGEGDAPFLVLVSPRRPSAPPTYVKAWLRRKMRASVRHRALPRGA